MDWNDLNGAQRKTVRAALLAGFDRDSLEMFLDEHFSKRLAAIVDVRAAMEKQVFDLIQLSQQEGWIGELIETAIASSENPKVKALGSLALLDVDGDVRLVAGSLEKTVRQNTDFEDLALWTQKLTDIRHRVCRIEDPQDPAVALGTGFLVSDAFVLTNFHVVKDYVEGRANPQNLRFRFDYAVEQGGTSEGKLIAADADWLAASAPFSPFDTGDTGGLPSTDHLDFALLRLAEPIGDAPIVAGGAKRGWIKLAQSPAAVQSGDVLFICQHPKGRPVKLAVGAALTTNTNQTRMRYDANTDNGSSGSPCFNSALQLVALHHGGDPGYSPLAEYNQGIPAATLVAHLAAKGAVPAFWRA